MTELNFQELAKQGNPQAIASFLQTQWQSEDITFMVNLNADFLEVILDGSAVPAQDKSVEFVRRELTDLQPDSIRLVKVDGREIGQLAAAWTQEFTLDSNIVSPQKSMVESSSNITVANQGNNMETANNLEAIQPEITGLENRLRSTFIVVGIVTGILAIAVAAFVGKLLNEPPTNAGKNLAVTPNVSTTTDPFRDAVNSAVKAADLGRAAKTKEEWNVVANRWQQAISLMRRVPPSSPHHEKALTKVAEYQKYLIYAQESAVTLPSPTPVTAEKESAEKSTKKSNSEKESTEKSTKKSNSEKESAEKANSKKSNSEKESIEKKTPSR